MSTEVKTGVDEEGRIFADVFRMGRLWRRFSSTGERPFESEAEARKHAKAKVHLLFR